MSLKASIPIAILSTCGSGSTTSTAPAGPDYDCVSIYDAGCDYEAIVEIQDGQVAVLDQLYLAEEDGYRNDGLFADVAGLVTVHDRQGVDPSVTCSFFVESLLFDQLESYPSGVDPVFTNDGAVYGATLGAQLDASGTDIGPCPIASPWFLPTSGSYTDPSGFGMAYEFDVYTTEISMQVSFGGIQSAWFVLEAVPLVDFGAPSPAFGPYIEEDGDNLHLIGTAELAASSYSVPIVGGTATP